LVELIFVNLNLVNLMFFNAWQGVQWMRAVVRELGVHTRNPKPETRTLHPKTENRNPKS